MLLQKVQRQTHRTLFLRPGVRYKCSVSREEKKCGRTKKPACVRVNMTEVRILNVFTRTHAEFWHILPFFSIFPHAGGGMALRQQGGRCLPGKRSFFHLPMVKSSVLLWDLCSSPFLLLRVQEVFARYLTIWERLCIIFASTSHIGFDRSGLLTKPQKT